MSHYSKSFIGFISLVSAMGGLLFGYDWVVIGGAKPFYELFFGISHSPFLQGVAMSTALVGCLLGAKEALHLNDPHRALQFLEQCLFYPPHLGEGRLEGAQDNDFHYLIGLAYEAMGETGRAHEHWEKAIKGPDEPVAAIYYNDARPDKIFYQGMALRKLGREAEARGRFNKLIAYGRNHIHEPQTMDYFAVSLPDLLIWEDSLDRQNVIHCLYMLALGYTGLGDTAHADRYLDRLIATDTNHQGAKSLVTFRRLCTA